MNETGPKERTMVRPFHPWGTIIFFTAANAKKKLYAAGALAGLTGLVYWVGYRAQGSTRNKKTREWTGSELDL